MTNFSRLHRMVKSELAEELTSLQKSDLLQYVDFDEWLESGDSALLPHGRKVIADVLIRNNESHQIVMRQMIECIIISDKEIFFGSRFYKIFDLSDRKIKSISFDSLEVIDI